MQGILYGLKPCVLAMVASAGLSLLLLSITGSQHITKGSEINIDYIALGLALGSFALLRIKKTSPIATMLIAGAVGFVLYLIF